MKILLQINFLLFNSQAINISKPCREFIFNVIFMLDRFTVKSVDDAVPSIINSPVVMKLLSTWSFDANEMKVILFLFCKLFLFSPPSFCAPDRRLVPGRLFPRIVSYFFLIFTLSEMMFEACAVWFMAGITEFCRFSAYNRLNVCYLVS